MNDELELIEEFQSDSIDELVSERKKNKVIQRLQRNLRTLQSIIT